MPTYLLTADVHLGRRSAGFENDPEASTRAAWLRICQAARDGRMDAVLVAGDLVDASAAYLYALDAVEEGLRVLDGIPLVAVAGNHDPDTLPRIARANAGRMRLFGPEEWETEELPGGMRTVGRSFAREEQIESLFADARPNPDGRTIGMVHGEFASPSRYHALRTDDLRDSALWLLGHIHRPHGEARWRYPGSPQAMDFGETGPHGALIGRWDGRELAFETLPVSSVRYDVLDVSVDADSTRETFEERIADWWREVRRPGLQARIRVRPVGATGLTSEQIEGFDFELPQGVVLDRYDFRNLRPALDLRALAGGVDARAALARLLLALDEPGFEEGEFAELGRRLAAKAREESSTRSRYGLLPDDLPAPDWKDAARRAAVRILESVPQ